MNKKYGLFIVLLIIASLVSFLWYSYPKQGYQYNTQPSIPDFNIVSEMRNSIDSFNKVITYEQSLTMTGSMEDLTMRIENPNQRILFDGMYNTINKAR